MDWLNYHHLLYFYVVAREGSIAKACEQLHLAQPTISSQLRKLEQTLGDKLFKRSGRNLVLTEAGQVVYRYAEEIFSLGQELVDTVHGRPTGRPVRLLVGVPDDLPKLVVYRLLEPALQMPEQVQISVQEKTLSELLSDLGSHQLDVVLSDTPAGPTSHIRAFNHLLGECGLAIFGAEKLTSKLGKKFPDLLDGAPLLLPTENSSLRRALEQWFDEHDIRPRIVGEFDDSALLNTFGQAGHGLFPAPLAVEAEVRQQFNVKIVGRIEDIRERYYAISVERRLKHPAVVAISTAAREKIFKDA
ncbi:MAG TPA: transcriptional activator NhaR [Pirellulaceae bacterium]|nr:transcriptional activator NhaR [Pirellulaceae bacterium]